MNCLIIEDNEIASLNIKQLVMLDSNVVDFITKPITPLSFLKSIERAKEVYNSKNQDNTDNNDDFIFIRDPTTVRRLKLDDILFLEAKGYHVRIATLAVSYLVHAPLKLLEIKLKKNIFLRVHRSFIINLSKVDTVEGITLLIAQNFTSF